jgi:hypothetical protein
MIVKEYHLARTFVVETTEQLALLKLMFPERPGQICVKRLISDDPFPQMIQIWREIKH